MLLPLALFNLPDRSTAYRTEAVARGYISAKNNHTDNTGSLLCLTPSCLASYLRAAGKVHVVPYTRRYGLRADTGRTHLISTRDCTSSAFYVPCRAFNGVVYIQHEGVTCFVPYVPQSR